MTANPACIVQNGVGPFVPTTGGVDITPSVVVSIKLASTVDVTAWYLEVIGTDELSTTPSLTNVNPTTHLVTSPSATASFTFPASQGRAIGIRSTVQGVGGPLAVTFGTYSLTAFSTRVGFVTETREGDDDFGWSTKLNPLIRSGGSSGDNFSYRTVPTSTTVTIPTYQQMIVVGAIDVEGTLVLDGELVLEV